MQKKPEKKTQSRECNELTRDIATMDRMQKLYESQGNAEMAEIVKTQMKELCKSKPQCPKPRECK